MLQALPDIQKGIFEIQLGGLTVERSIPEIQLGGLTVERSIPDLHRAISIFEIQFAGATTTSRYPKRNFSHFASDASSEVG